MKRYALFMVFLWGAHLTIAQEIKPLDEIALLVKSAEESTGEQKIKSFVSAAGMLAAAYGKMKGGETPGDAGQAKKIAELSARLVISGDIIVPQLLIMALQQIQSGAVQIPIDPATGKQLDPMAAVQAMVSQSLEQLHAQIDKETLSYLSRGWGGTLWGLAFTDTSKQYAVQWAGAILTATAIRGGVPTILQASDPTKLYGQTLLDFPAEGLGLIFDTLVQSPVRADKNIANIWDIFIKILAPADEKINSPLGIHIEDDYTDKNIFARMALYEAQSGTTLVDIFSTEIKGKKGALLAEGQLFSTNIIIECISQLSLQYAQTLAAAFDLEKINLPPLIVSDVKRVPLINLILLEYSFERLLNALLDPDIKKDAGMIATMLEIKQRSPASWSYWISCNAMRGKYIPRKKGASDDYMTGSIGGRFLHAIETHLKNETNKDAPLLGEDHVAAIKAILDFFEAVEETEEAFAQRMHMESSFPKLIYKIIDLYADLHNTGKNASGEIKNNIDAWLSFFTDTAIVFKHQAAIKTSSMKAELTPAAYARTRLSVTDPEVKKFIVELESAITRKPLEMLAKALHQLA